MRQNAARKAQADMVNSPAHYNKGKVECIDAIDTAVVGLTGSEAHYTGNVMKYIWRWKEKGGVEDLRKAQWYLTRLVNALDVPGVTCKGMQHSDWHTEAIDEIEERGADYFKVGGTD